MCPLRAYPQRGILTLSYLIHKGGGLHRRHIKGLNSPGVYGGIFLLLPAGAGTVSPVVAIVERNEVRALAQTIRGDDVCPSQRLGDINFAAGRIKNNRGGRRVLSTIPRLMKFPPEVECKSIAAGERLKG